MLNNYNDPTKAADEKMIAVSAASLDVAKIRNKYNEMQQKYEKLRSNPNQLVVFVSLDIVGSVKLKQNETFNWLNLFLEFHKTLKSFPIKQLKNNGDEIIFAQPVSDLACIAKIIETTSKRTLQAHKNFTKLGLDKKFYVKSTVWVAETGNTTRNIVIEYLTGDGFIRDYLGINVDEGFRLAGFASANTVTIDPKIVMLLAKAIKQNPKEQVIKKCLENIVLDGCQYLKDIWPIEDAKQQKYPIFRYYTDISDLNIRHPELDFAKKSNHTNDDIIEMLRKIFQRAGVYEKEVKNMLQLMNIDCSLHEHNFL